MVQRAVLLPLLPCLCANVVALACGHARINHAPHAWRGHCGCAMGRTRAPTCPQQVATPAPPQNVVIFLDK
jgi:hypothetical protein